MFRTTPADLNHRLVDQPDLSLNAAQYERPFVQRPLRASLWATIASAPQTRSRRSRLVRSLVQIHQRYLVRPLGALGGHGVRALILLSGSCGRSPGSASSRAAPLRLEWQSKRRRRRALLREPSELGSRERASRASASERERVARRNGSMRGAMRSPSPPNSSFITRPTSSRTAALRRPGLHFRHGTTPPCTCSSAPPSA